MAERLRALFFNHSMISLLCLMSGEGLSPALATCETSQVLLAGVPDAFSLCSPVFTHLLIEIILIEKDVKLN